MEAAHVLQVRHFSCKNNTCFRIVLIDYKSEYRYPRKGISYMQYKLAAYLHVVPDAYSILNMYGSVLCSINTGS